LTKHKVWCRPNSECNKSTPPQATGKQLCGYKKSEAADQIRM